ncbi:MAG TPA: hypothetical protein VIM79_21810 [Niastella sp.]
MDIHTEQQRRFPAVALVIVLFTLCIIPGQFYITKLFPAIAGLVQMKPSLVFLDIPIQLPVTIDMILVPALFLLVYPVVILFFPSRRQMLYRVRAAFTGLFVLLICMIAGGVIYYFAQDHLSQSVRNGINSMGMIADIHLPYRGYETIPVRGSLVIMVCFIIGMFIFIRKLRKEPAAQLTREQRMTPYERMLQERRMNKKQMTQETRTIHRNEFNHETNHADLIRQPIQARTNGQSGLCYSQPVMRLKPEALYYMPV